MKSAQEMLIQATSTEYEDLMKILEGAIEWAASIGHHNVDVVVGNFSDEAIEKAVETLKANGYRAYYWTQEVAGKSKKVITIRWK